MKKVGIIGMGVIGSANAEMFSRAFDVVTYDKATDDSYPYQELAKCELIVVCVGTPERPDGSADLSGVAEAAALLPPEASVLLRSTVPPGTTNRLFGQRACYMPEFMGENPFHPWQKPTDVPFLILGGNSLDDRARVGAIVDLVHPAGRGMESGRHSCTVKVAEMVKYLSNLFWAAKVTFVNEMARVCDSLEVDYEDVREAWLRDGRVDPSYTAFAGHEPGFGGRCWPKDLAAMINAAEGAGYEPGFLRAIQDANVRFRS